jgi:hypothetical protein
MGGPGSGPKPFSARRERARRLRAGGLSLSGIARALGCTKQGVHYLLTGRGPGREQPPLVGLGRRLRPGGRAGAVAVLAQSKSWADVLTVAGFAGAIAVLGFLAWRTGRPPE